MTGIKAVWHLAELSDAEEDPFQAVAYSVGVTLDLTADEDGLYEQVKALLRREQRLHSSGVSCPLKDGGQDCLTCPSATLDPAEPRSRLCRLGKDQRTVQQRHEERSRERRAPLRELAAVAEEASLLGHLDDDLSELLTEVGL